MTDKIYRTIPDFRKAKIILSLFSFLCIFFWSINVSAKANWYKYGPVIHACGSYKGHDYTNSKEALLNTLKVKKAQKILPIEIDFMLTSDKVPVCVHDWRDYNYSNGFRSGARLSLRQFKHAHTRGGFTPMTAYQAIDIMAKTKNAYLVIDTKEKGYSIYRRIAKACIETGHQDFLKRIIVQLYDFKDYRKIRKIYPFKHWLLSTYKLNCWTPEKIRYVVKKAKKTKIDVLVMPYATFVMKRNNRYKLLYKNIKAANTKRRIPLLCHTVNNIRIAAVLYHFKFNGIYTDSLYMQ